MADRYLLESSSTDGYQLEDGSGVLLLEGEDAPFFSARSETLSIPSRQKQRGSIDLLQSLVLTTLAVVAGGTEVLRAPIVQPPVVRKPYDQVEFTPSRAILSAAPEVAPFVPVDIAQELARKPYQQQEPHQNPFARYGILAAPFRPVDTTPVPFARPDSLEESFGSPFELYAILAAPFRPVDQNQHHPRYPDDHSESHASPFELYAILAAPFVPVEFPAVTPPKVYRQLEEVPNVYPLWFGTIPFTPVDTYQSEVRAAADFEQQQAPYVLLRQVVEVAPFVPIDFVASERRAAPGGIDVAQAPYTLWAGTVPFTPIDTYRPEPRAHLDASFEQASYVLLRQVVAVAPFVPVDLPQPVTRAADGELERQSAPYLLWFSTIPFTPRDTFTPEPRAQPDLGFEATSYVLLRQVLAVSPFVPVDFGTPERRAVDGELDVRQNSYLLWFNTRPFVQSEVGQLRQKKHEYDNFFHPGNIELTGVPFRHYETAQDVEPIPDYSHHDGSQQAIWFAFYQEMPFRPVDYLDRFEFGRRDPQRGQEYFVAGSPLPMTYNELSLGKLHLAVPNARTYLVPPAPRVYSVEINGRTYLVED